LIYYFQDLPNKNFKSKFDDFKWENSKKNFKAWSTGNTGFPIIDAGMRELYETGYMHNRVRMITASFLTKHCLTHWKIGAKWFSYTLLDCDIASNNAGWQWVAGTGADAAPYFRIFNPIRQSEKFDKNGEYIKKWVPELKNLPSKYVHAPHLAPDQILKEFGVKLGENYPDPILDLDIQRKKALDYYSKIK
jgi:deoxyribodipyrimidine photo-lyase